VFGRFRGLTPVDVVGGWPLLWPDTYLRRLNQTIEKIIASQKSLVSIIFF
jgi:hypothetical protein